MVTSSYLGTRRRGDGESEKKIPLLAVISNGITIATAGSIAAFDAEALRISRLSRCILGICRASILMDLAPADFFSWWLQKANRENVSNRNLFVGTSNYDAARRLPHANGIYNAHTSRFRRVSANQPGPTASEHYTCCAAENIRPALQHCINRGCIIWIKHRPH